MAFFDDGFFGSMSLVPMRMNHFTMMDRLLGREPALLRRLHSDVGRDFDLISHRLPSMDEEMRRFASEVDRFRRNNMYRLMPADSIRSNDLVSLQSPGHIVSTTDSSTDKKFQLRVDVSNFSPEEVEVKIKDDFLVVHAKRVVEKEGSKSHSEFLQRYKLPESVVAAEVTSALSEDGVLTVEAPVDERLGGDGGRIIPIRAAGKSAESIGGGEQTTVKAIMGK